MIDPLEESHIQPSSVDLRVDRYFRVFRNDTTPYIDPKRPQEDLTELVEVADGKAFILHPGEFVLGSTLEVVTLPDDLVARLEGKSSLGRLGLLIHSSLPGSEPVVVSYGGRVEVLPIETVVRKGITGSVAAFDPETLQTAFLPITGWFEGPPDRIFEVKLASGRSVRVTAGHNLFTLDRDGTVRKVRTGELRPNDMVAVPRMLPSPGLADPVIDLRDFVPEADERWLMVEGPTVAAAFDELDLAGLLRDCAYGLHVGFYRERQQVPFRIARLAGDLVARLGSEDRLRGRGARRGLPVRIPLDPELAWFIGLYVAEGYRRRNQVVVSNTDAAILDRAEAVLNRLGQTVYRSEGISITCTSQVLSALLGWIGTGGMAPAKRLPAGFLGWPRHLLDALFEGLMDGDGSYDEIRDSYWTSSPGLKDDMLLLAQRMGRPSAAYRRERAGTVGLYQVAFPHRRHKLGQSVPLPNELLIAIRNEVGLSQKDAARMAGFKWPTDLNNIERRRGRDAVRLPTLERLRDAYAIAGTASGQRLLDRLVDGDVAWDRVLEVRDTGEVETIFDLEVRPEGRHIENFVAGSGGVFVSNTAGFVDAGFSGHLTLELSNVANLPIAIYPGMKIGQISFIRMDAPAERPYGSRETGSKYQGQRGPTPSRYYLNFAGEDEGADDQQ